ncbi:hypothetical protein [Pseudoxanthomonas wuyuanensis]
MLRALTILLSLCVWSAAAQNGRTAVPGNTTSCQELAEKSADASLQQVGSPRAATAVAVRNKYAQPATPANAPSATPVRGGGGDDDDAPMARPRAPKWHSFLPGMFR